VSRKAVGRRDEPAEIAIDASQAVAADLEQAHCQAITRDGGKPWLTA
jgi:hypothetical protein